MALTLPDTANLGDTGHISDHNLIVTALSTLDTAVAAKAPSASPTFTGTVTLTGATVVGLASGLTYITSGTATGASSLSINNCFTASYQNYRVMVNISASSGNTDFLWRYRASASDNSTANHYGYVTRVAADGSTANQGSSGTTAWTVGGGYSSLAGTRMAFDVYSPQLAAKTDATVSGFSLTTSGGQVYMVGGCQFNATTQFDGFTIYPASGTFTGTVRVYGYE